MTELSRRTFTKSAFVGTPMIVGGTGCLLPLLRLILSRALVSALLRGFKARSNPAFMSIGRGAAIGDYLLNMHPEGQYNTLGILNEDGILLASARNNKSSLDFYAKTNDRFYATRRHRSNLIHYDLDGTYLGRSANVFANELHYFNSSDQLVGSDKINSSNLQISHYDRRGKNVGTSELRLSKNNGLLYGNEKMTKYLNSLFEAEIFKCPQANNQMKIFRSTQSRCSGGDKAACRNSKSELTKLSVLIDQCSVN